jgi:hypothetical protein
MKKSKTLFLRRALVFAMTAGISFFCLAQTTADTCIRVIPVTLVVVNDRHPANFAFPFGSDCVKDEEVTQDICLPIGIVAGNLSVTEISHQGLYSVNYNAIPAEPHCTRVTLLVRPNHKGINGGYQCLSRALATIEVTLVPLVEASLCSTFRK